MPAGSVLSMKWMARGGLIGCQGLRHELGAEGRAADADRQQVGEALRLGRADAA